MTKFRKRPVVIEAVQWLPEDMEQAGGMAAWLQIGNCDFEIGNQFSPRSLYIRTLEGVMEAAPEDWIIKGVKGEFYPCKPDIFAETYEAVS